MKIVGISNATDSGACLFINNRLVSAINEERLIKQKNYKGFPNRSFSALLKINNLEIEDVDYFVFGMWQMAYQNMVPSSYLMKLLSSNKKEFEIIKNKLNHNLKSDNKAYQEILSFLKKKKINTDKAIFFNHHLSHSFSGYFFSGFEKSYSLVMDGRGDFISTSLWYHNKYDYKKVIDVSDLSSAGVFYGIITQYLGFNPERHAGKVTGLSARGRHTNLIEILEKNIFNLKNNKLDFSIGDYFLPYATSKPKKLYKILNNYSKFDIAFAAQYLLEKYVKFIIKNYISDKRFNLCLSGGCFANVKLNFEISKNKRIKNIFIFPGMSDTGVHVGAVAALLNKKKKYYKGKLNDLYLGNEQNEIPDLSFFIRNKISYKEFDLDEIINLLYKRKVVAIFQGKMEFGPRALCNRSVLFRANDKNNTSILNKYLSRSDFMPFAPIILRKNFNKYFISPNTNLENFKYMTICCKVKSNLKKLCPAIVHIDNTARPQIIDKKTNKLAHDILLEFEKLTNEPCLINTSFNTHEYPIVCSLRDSLLELSKNRIDVLVTKDYIYYR